jgi:hypothetical protein
MRRYLKDNRLAGTKKATAQAVSNIRKAQRLGLISVNPILIKESQRLDHLAHQYLKDSQLWWVLAATSNIGWGMQVPPGTIILVPTNLSQIGALV